MGIAAALGIGSAVADIIGGSIQQRQQRKAAKRGAGTRRELESIFGEQVSDLKGLPGILKRAREGRISTAAAERRKRLDRALATSGATGASTAGMIGDRGVMESVERMSQEAQLAEQAALNSARQQVFNTGAQLNGIQTSVPTSFYNPLSAVKAGIGGYALGSQLGNAFGQPAGDYSLGKGLGVPDPRYTGDLSKAFSGRPAGSYSANF